MKKFFVSTGLAAIGACGLQSVCAQGLDIVSPKAWSINGTLRGFYDDNYDISGTKKGSWGVEVSPQIGFNLPLQQTDMGFRYSYGAYFYEDRNRLHLDAFDMSHQLEVYLDHAINEHWHLKITDTFSIGQEPELLQSNPLTGVATPFRINGNNLSNHAEVTLDTQWTHQFGTSVHYGNSFYDFQNKGAGVTTTPVPVFSTTPFPLSPFVSNASQQSQAGWQKLTGNGASLSGLLDRIEQTVGLDLNWTFSPETTFFLGGNYSWVNYSGNEPVAVYNYAGGYVNIGSLYFPVAPRSFVYMSNDRDGGSYEGHFGLTHQLTANISVMLTAGVSYTDSKKDPFNHTTAFSPSANASISYTYIPGSYVQLGISHGENATDVVQPGFNGSLTQYQHTTTIYADLNHKITEKLSGTLIGRYAFSSYESGAASGQGDSDFNVGLNLHYQFSRHFSGEAGYNFDDLISNLLGRGYIRNRVYLGLAANY
jgi:hypothetical protein